MAKLAKLLLLNALLIVSQLEASEDVNNTKIITWDYSPKAGEALRFGTSPSIRIYLDGKLLGQGDEVEDELIKRIIENPSKNIVFHYWPYRTKVYSALFYSADSLRKPKIIDRLVSEFERLGKGELTITLKLDQKKQFVPEDLQATLKKRAMEIKLRRRE